MMHRPPPTEAEIADANLARTLVMWSHITGWGGLAVLIFGFPLVGGIAGPTAGVAAVGLGFVSMVTGAIIGQVGRAKQGRVI